MKKIITFLVLALVVLTGCSQNDSETGAEGVVTLKVSHNMDFVTIPNAVLEAGKRLNEKYAAEGKDLQIEFATDYQRIDWGEYQQSLIFAEKNGDGADIFSLGGDLYSLVKAEMLLDISDLVTDDFVSGSYDGSIIGGKAYAMPFDLPLRAIYYNKNALVSIGWSPEEIESLPLRMASGDFSWEQFISLCQEVQDKGAAKWGLAHRPGDGSDFFDILNVLGGEYYDEEGRIVVDEAGLTRFFEFTYDAANTMKITPPDLNQQGWPTINALVGSGDAFAYYGPIYSATYVAGSVDMTPAEFAENVAFAPYPKSEYSEKAFVSAAPQTMAINANTKYPEICKDLFRELYAGGSTDMLAKHGGTIFSLSSVKEANEHEDITTNPILKDIGYMQDYSKTIPPLAGISTYETQLHSQIVLLELGQTDAQTAYENLKVQMELNIDSDSIVFK